jgi:hypothetical protein
MNRFGKTVLVLALMQLNPVAHALLSDLGDTCNNTLEQIDLSIEYDCKNNPTHQKCKDAANYFKENGGENLMGYCSKAKLANRSKNFELTKSIIYTAAATNCGAMIFMEAALFTQTAAKIACSRTGAIAGAAGIATDLLGVATISHKTKEFSKIIENVSFEKIDKERWAMMGVTAGAGGLSYLGRIFADPSQPLVSTGITPNGSQYTWNSGNPQIARPAGGDQTLTMDPHQMDTRPSLTESTGVNTSASASQSKKGLAKFWDKNKQKIGCVICAASFGYLGTKSFVDQYNYAKSRDADIKIAEGLFSATQDSVNSFNAAFNTGDRKRSAKSMEASTSSAMDREDCLGPKKSNDAVLTCLSKQVPEVAAITNDPALLNEFKRAFRGKGLGDVINQFDEKKYDSVPNYVADVMGIPRDFVAKVMDQGSQIAASKGFTPSHSAMSYTSSKGSAARSSEGDANRIAASVNSSLSDTEFESTPEISPALSEQDRLFRQLDLMGPQEIYENKNISLFVRIAYRYHKSGGVLQPGSKPSVNRVIGSESK